MLDAVQQLIDETKPFARRDAMSAIKTPGHSQRLTVEALGYCRLVAGLALAAFAMTILSVFVGYARLDVLQALWDFVHGTRSLPALALVQLPAFTDIAGLFSCAASLWAGRTRRGHDDAD